MEIFLDFSLDFSLRLSYVVTRRFRRPSFFFSDCCGWNRRGGLSTLHAPCNSSLFLCCVHMFTLCNLISTALPDGFFSFFSLRSLSLPLPFFTFIQWLLRCWKQLLVFGAQADHRTEPRWQRGNCASDEWADGTALTGQNVCFYSMHRWASTQITYANLTVYGVVNLRFVLLPQYT